MARPNLRESTVRVPEIAIPSDQAGARAPDQQSSEAASRRGVQRTSDEILTNLLTTRRDETLSRVIGDDPHAALSKLLELSPEDVVKTSASKLPNLAVDEALKASASQAMAPIAQLPARDVFKALESAMSPEKIAELAKLFPKTESPIDGANYKTFDNLDIESSSVIKLKNSGLQSCVSVCRQKENCKAYTFDKWNHVCYIKSKIGDFKLNPRSSSGIRDDVQAPRPPAGNIAMEHYHLKAFPGSGYRNVRADGPGICENLCRTEEICVAFTFNFGDESCRLFNSTNEYFSDSSAESGGKRQN
jgi:hypothetical protein